MINRNLFIFVALATVSLSHAGEQVEVRWQAPFDYRLQTASTTRLEATHLLPNGRITNVVALVANPSQLFFTTLNADGSVLRSLNISDGQTQHTYVASGSDSASRTQLASVFGFSPGRLDRYGPDGALQTSFQPPAALKDLAVLADGNTLSVHTPSVISKRLPGGGPIWEARAVGFVGPLIGVGSPMVLAAPNGDVISVGTYLSFGAGNVDETRSFLMRTTSTGTVLYYKTLPYAVEEAVAEAALDMDGNIILRTSTTSSANTLRWIRGSDGKQIWQRSMQFRRLKTDSYGRIYTRVYTGTAWEIFQFSRGGTPMWSVPINGEIDVDRHNEIYVAADQVGGGVMVTRLAQNGVARYSKLITSPAGQLASADIDVDDETGGIFLRGSIRPDEQPFPSYTTRYANLVALNRLQRFTTTFSTCRLTRRRLRGTLRRTTIMRRARRSSSLSSLRVAFSIGIPTDPSRTRRKMASRGWIPSLTVCSVARWLATQRRFGSTSSSRRFSAAGALGPPAAFGFGRYPLG